MAVSSNRLIKLGLVMSAASGAFAGLLPDQPGRRGNQGNQGNEPLNGGFETGNLQGWQVVSGDAFGNRSVTDAASYWGGPFYQDQKYFIWGITQAGEAAVGELKSSSFRASSVLSFLIGGGYDPDKLYVGLVRDSDNRLLLKQTGTNDEALIRIVWDTSKWAGQKVHVVIHDSSTSESWGHINFDDLRVGPRALGNGGDQTFQVIGQANQPAPRKSSACSLYAADPLRPQYHYTPYQGWINDPSGLVEWKGRHHLFSQFNPDAPVWGPMHWAHAVSTDAVHWRELPVALAPPKTTIPGDASGRFTGSAMVRGGKLDLVFTDFTDGAAHPGAVQQTVAVASSTDGVNFSLYPQNPVVPGPPAGAPVDFRDPKVFHDTTDNSTKMVIGATNGAQGQVQLYRSTDSGPYSWSHVGVLTTGDGSTGSPWECPNLLPLGDKWALLYGGNALGWYETGTYNGSVFTTEKRGLLDAGPAAYAVQWYQDESGRDLAITWMANWPTSKWPTRVNGWAGQQSITRELFLREDGGVGSRPIKELDSLAVGPAKNLGRLRVGEQARSIGDSNTARVKLTVDLGATSASSFTVAVFQSRAESTLLTYDVASRKLTLDTTNGGYGQAGKWDAVLAEPKDKKLTLDIFLDRTVLEVFAGDGTVMSATVFPRYKESTGISVVGSKGTVTFAAGSVTRLGSSWC
jgi:sucrose-6-phosphate hydrolase SacC (GH32 family)